MMLIRILVLMVVSGGAFAACEQTLSAGANVGAAIVAAAAGNEICLNNGNYPGFAISGTSKSPRVTVRALTPNGAIFTSGIEFSGGANGFTIDGVKLAGVDIFGANTREITLRNADASLGSIIINDVTIETPNILFENLTHVEQDNFDGGCRGAPFPCVGTAAYHFSFSGRSTPLATIRGAVIDGGCADGIQSGVPFILENSIIRNKIVGDCTNDPHTDATQLYGGPFAGTIIRKNYYLNNVQVIAAYDGVDGVLIEDNILDPGTGAERRPCQIELYSDDSSIVRRNTIVYRDASYPGLICLDKKTGFDNGFGTVIVDNIAGGVSALSGSTWGTRSNNLIRSGSIAGETSGSPTYTGGTNPSTWAGFALAAGSLGKGAATTIPGADLGSNFFGAAAPSAPAITSALTKACTVGTACSYTITCSNSPDTFTVTGLPAGLSFASPTLSGTPTTAGTVNTTIGCSNAAGSDSQTLVYTISAASDTTNPTVSISAPAGGTTVSGTAVNIAANAADNVGVVGVQFRVDGANVGAEDTVSPYSISWNSTTVGNGSRVITAVARDAAGNTATSSAVTVTVSNAVVGGACPGVLVVLGN